MTSNTLENLDEKEIRELALKYALLNAVKHEGRAQIGPVISKIMAERPEYRKIAKQIARIVAEVVKEVNKKTVSEQRRILEEKWPELLVERKKEERKIGLPPLPNAEKYKVIKTRFAPNPDFVLHLGNARPALLSYEYAVRYKGKMILRFEDTDPRIKRPLAEAYKAIKEDLKWLGIKWDEEYIQSLRLEIYYEIARELISRSGAYVDLCKPDEFRKYRNTGKPCPHRDKPVEDQLELWDKMLEGYFGEGEAVLRVKTPLDYPDPSVREWVAFRIIDTSKTPHPLVGDKYIVWPTYNFAAAVDDHLMEVTHILRAKEHKTNTIKQQFLYKHMGWKYPEAIHFGRLKLEGFMLSKSKMRELMEKEDYEGYDDPRFGTLSALRKRGITPEAIRNIIMEVGVKHTDAVISYENLSAVNRKIVDPIAIRLMFTPHPFKVIIENAPERIEIEIPLHPSNAELGKRRIVLEGTPVQVYVSSNDVDLIERYRSFRLMDLGNLELVEIDKGARTLTAKYIGNSLEEARRRRLPIIQWTPVHDNVDLILKKPVGDNLIYIMGKAEPYTRSVKSGTIVQFLRVGFARIHSVGEKIIAYYAHD